MERTSDRRGGVGQFSRGTLRLCQTRAGRRRPRLRLPYQGQVCIEVIKVLICGGHQRGSVAGGGLGEAPAFPVSDRRDCVRAGRQLVGEEARGPTVFGEFPQAGGGSVRFNEAGEQPFASAGGVQRDAEDGSCGGAGIRAGHASAERSRRRTRVTATPDVSAMSAADPTAHVVGPPEHAAGHEWLRSTAKGRHLPRRPALALRQPVVLRFVGREAPAGLGRGPLGAVPAQGVRGRRQPLRPGPGPPSSGSSGPSSQPGRPAGSERSHGRPARTSFHMMPFGTWRRSRPGRPVRGGADSGSITCQA